MNVKTIIAIALAVFMVFPFMEVCNEKSQDH